DQLAQDHITEMAVVNDFLKTCSVALEVGEQVRPFLVPVDRVGQPALVPLTAGHDIRSVLRQNIVDVLDRVVPGYGSLRAVQEKHRFIGIDWQEQSSFNNSCCV